MAEITKFQQLGGRPTTFTPQVLEFADLYFDSYEPWYESPVERQLKDGSTETRMERLPSPPPSVLDLHRFLKSKGLTVSRWSLYDWADFGKPTEIPEFSQLIKRAAERLYPEVLQENAMLGKYSNAFAIFAAKNRMGWTDKQENTMRYPEPLVIKGSDGKPIETLGSNT